MTLSLCRTFDIVSPEPYRSGADLPHFIVEFIEQTADKQIRDAIAVRTDIVDLGESLRYWQDIPNYETDEEGNRLSDEVLFWSKRFTIEHAVKVVEE